ncbi:MAG: flagellar hook-basal body complex protein FliE [Lachnospiraceae bacterium]|jgi:flagellar hook-basal body complex protein FliE|nr:flagellar hook-basal body complex protein FliE [Lachnospiraceae bacterium]
MDVVGINHLYKTTEITTPRPMATDGNDFGRVLDAAKNMIKETNNLQNAAQMEEMKFALGLADNTHDVMIAERKAQVALNYTVAVRDRFLQSYQTIMNMQI